MEGFVYSACSSASIQRDHGQAWTQTFLLLVLHLVELPQKLDPQASIREKINTKNE